MKQEWLAFLSAVQFLTRLPVPDPGWEEGRLDRAAMYFPLVGAIVGLLCGIVYAISAYVFHSDLLGALFALTTGILLTGALHEDGLADFADGVGGGRDRQHRLEIMKDSRIGSYGAIALLLALSINVAALERLSVLPFFVVAALISAHGISRTVLPIVAALTPYARSVDGDKTAPLSNPLPTLRLVGLIAVSIVIIMPVVLVYIELNSWQLTTGRFAYGRYPTLLRMVMAVFITCAFAALMTWIAQRKLGGWTGDSLGATQVVCFSTFLVLVWP